MSRPKGSKNKKTLERLNLEKLRLEEQTNTIPTNTINTIPTPDPNIPILSSKTKSIKPLPTCSRCNTEILTTPIYINVSTLTGLPNWHRCLKNDRIVLCRDCAMEMNDIIDKWLYNKGKGVESKYPV